MNKPTHIILLAALLLAACSTDDNYYRTPHPELGAVTVTTSGYAGEHRLIAYASADTVQGETSTSTSMKIVQGETSTFSPLLPEGKYTLAAFNLPEGMTNEEGSRIIRVDRREDGTLEPHPGKLVSNTTQVEVSKDDTLHVYLPLQQRTRELRLKLTPKDYEEYSLFIDRVEVLMKGIAPALDVTNNKLTGKPASMKTAFALQGNDFTAELNLLGIFTDKPNELDITIYTKDGKSQTLEKNVNEQLKTFNQGTTPFNLNILLTMNLIEDMEPQFGITDWTEGEGGTVEAN